MKKSLRILMAILTVICVIAVTEISIQADARNIKSRGNFVLDSGKMSIHASDIEYLQSEVQSLYSELPAILEINVSGGGTARRNDLHSKGIIDYKNGMAILDSSDLTLLADEIDTLESEYKANTVAALSDINTYFNIDSSVSHDQRDETLSSPYANDLSFDEICNGIVLSQSVDHLESTPIIADNLTAGTAAWVNGTCIIGNGADNERAYKKGRKDGEDGEDGDGEDIDMEYTYHTHRNSSGEAVTKEKIYASSNPGGCYAAAGHTHNQTGGCSTIESVTREELGQATRSDGSTYWRALYQCKICGITYTSSEYPEYYDVPATQYCPAGPHYNCDGKTNTWEIGCGKQNGDIESVKITIRKREGEIK